MKYQEEVIEIYRYFRILRGENHFYGVPYNSHFSRNDNSEITGKGVIFAETIPALKLLIDGASSFLRHIRMDITDNCNLRCLMCETYNHVPKNKIFFLNFDVFRKRCAGHLGKVICVHVGNVAEPLLHPSFGDFIRFIRAESDASIQILTNGNLLHKHVDLINSCNCQVSVSLDSFNPEVYKKIRVGGDLDRTLGALNLINQDKVFIDQTMMRCNIEEFGDFIEYCKAHNWKFTSRPMCIKDAVGIISKNVIDESLWFDKNVIRTWEERFQGNDFGEIVQSPLLKTQSFFSMETSKCSAHWDDLVIRGDGACLLCGAANIGNLNDADLKSIYNSEKAVPFRNSIDKGLENSPCSNCDYLIICHNPQIDNLRNYVTGRIYNALGDDLIAKLQFDSGVSDDEQKKLFTARLAEVFNVFDFVESRDAVSATRISGRDIESGNDASAASVKYGSRIEVEGIIRNTLESYYVPKLVKNYLGYNLVKYEERYFAVPLNLGILDLTLESHRTLPGIIDETDIVELERKIDQSEYWPFPVLWKAGYKGFNIVRYKTRYIGMSNELGTMDIAQTEEHTLDEYKKRNLCVTGSSNDEVEQLIDIISRLP